VKIYIVKEVTKGFSDRT